MGAGSDPWPADGRVRRRPPPIPEAAEQAPPAGKESAARTGEIRNLGDGLLPSGAWETAAGFLDACFAAEERLEEGEFATWFDLEDSRGYESYVLHRLYWSCLIKTRRMRPQDMALSTWRYGLTCLSAEEEGEAVTALFQEDSVREFAFAPGVQAGNLGFHLMGLVETETGWKIREYLDQQDLGNAIAQEYARRKEARGIEGPATRQQADAIATQMEEEYLAEAEKDVRKTALSLARDDGEEGARLERGVGHAYDRERALAYARAWAWGGSRRLRCGSWPDYEDYGGDCQNFVSQCLHAGGIPMDWQGAEQWKWLGHTPDVRQLAWGRSPSWSAVKDFYAYCQENEGRGLAAQTDAPLGGLRSGDVLQFASLGDWRHSVLVTGEVRDKSGRLLDLLVASHSADRENWPLSAYAYTTVRGIRILGWNE